MAEPETQAEGPQAPESAPEAPAAAPERSAGPGTGGGEPRRGRGGRGGGGGRGGERGGRGDRGGRRDRGRYRAQRQIVQKVVDINRAATVGNGRRRFAFNALGAVGDGKTPAGLPTGQGHQLRAP